MNILIGGGTGFVGSALSSYLLEKHHSVTIKTRRTDVHDNRIRYINELEEAGPGEAFDVVINLAGEPIADKRWTARQRKELLRSRLDSTQEFINYFGKPENRPAVFISGSAIGFYGVGSGDEAIDENCAGDNSFSSELCKQWEACALQAESLGIRTCLLRTGIVLGRNGGALAKMLPPFRLGLGGRVGTGEQWMPWIHLDDLVGMINYCMHHEAISGPVNGTAPEPVRNKTFVKALGKALGRPAILPLPAFVINLLMGDMGKELLLAGKKVLPSKMEKTDFQFKYRRLEEALSDIL
jgi:uncharacterized protein (TIGR01777 family)